MPDKRSSPTVGRRPAHLFIGVLFFASGISALIYELLWVRKVTFVVGAHAYAVSTVLASFFAGMAGGAFVFGEWLGRRRDPLRVYGLLEIGAAFSAAAVTWALDHPGALHGVVKAFSPDSEVGSAVLRFAFTFALLSVPTFLMGGTLPVLSRGVTSLGEPLGREIGRLYALNTLGAVIGVLGSAFVLVRTLGVNASLALAVGLNVLIGVLALALGRRLTVVDDTRAPPRRDASPAAESARGPAFALSALSGLTGLAYEVVWTRVLVQVLFSRMIALAMVLAIFLLGIVAGSWIASKRVDRLRSPWQAYALLQLAVAFSSVLALWLLGPALSFWRSSLEPALATRGAGDELVWLAKSFFIPLSILAAPTLLIGASFPVAVRLVGRHASVASDVGRLYFVNTLGGVAGSLLAGFVLIPSMGTQASLFLLAGLNAIAAVVAGSYGFPAPRARVALAAVSLGAVALAVWRTPSDSILRVVGGQWPGRMLFHEEGVDGTVAIYEEAMGGRRWRRLVINGSSNTGDIMSSRRYMRLQAHLPVLIRLAAEAPPPTDALVICLGTGITYGGLFLYDELGRRVCVELSEAVVHGAEKFRDVNGDVLSRPDAEIVVADGRHYLLAREGAFDVITLEPPPPHDTGAVNLYTREFYRLCKSRLRPHGVMAQWLPLMTRQPDLKMVVRAFVEEFPHASLWTTERQETLLIGSSDPLRIDYAKLAAAIERPAVARDLAQIGVRTAPELLSLFLLDERALAEYARDDPPLTDDFPRLEYAFVDRGQSFFQTLPDLLARRSSIEPYLANAGDRAAVLGETARRAELLDSFYRSGLAYVQGDGKTANALMGKVFAADPQNEYFLSFLDPQTAERVRAGAGSD